MLMKSKFIDCRKFADCTGDRRAASERRPSRCWRRASGATRAHKVSVAGFASGLRAGVPGWSPRTERGWERCFRRKAGHFSISAVVVSYVRARARPRAFLFGAPKTVSSGKFVRLLELPTYFSACLSSSFAGRTREMCVHGGSGGGAALSIIIQYTLDSESRFGSSENAVGMLVDDFYGKMHGPPNRHN